MLLELYPAGAAQLAMGAQCTESSEWFRAGATGLSASHDAGSLGQHHGLHQVLSSVPRLPPQPMVINVPVGPSPPTASRPQSPQPQSSSRPRKTSSSHSIPAAPSPSIRPVPVFGHPPQSVSPSPGQMPPQAPQNLPVFAFPQNQNRSGGQLPVFALPGREPGQPGGPPPSSPSALPIFAPSGGLAGLGAVPGMALPQQQLTPRTPRTPRDEQTSPTAQVAPSSPSQPPQEPVQEVQDSEAEWMNLRKGITTSTEGFANEEEGGKEAGDCISHCDPGTCL